MIETHFARSNGSVCVHARAWRVCVFEEVLLCFCLEGTGVWSMQSSMTKNNLTVTLLWRCTK